MSLDGPQTVLIGYASEALWHETAPHPSDGTLWVWGGILESLCDAWRETLGRRQQRDIERVLGDSLGAAPAIDGEAARAVRVCQLYSETKRPRSWRDWKSVAGMISEPLFPDWPLEGARTTKWLVMEMVKSGGGPLQHYQSWKTQLRADGGDRSVHEHELLCMALELNGCYDQLDLPVLAGMNWL